MVTDSAKDVKNKARLWLGRGCSHTLLHRFCAALVHSSRLLPVSAVPLPPSSPGAARSHPPSLQINRYAFSGGQALAEDQRRLGADLSVDVAYQYLTFFLEDDAELKQIGDDYAAGRLLTGEVKAKLISVLVPMVEAHQKARALVTDATVDAFMKVRPLELARKAAAAAAVAQ